MLLLLLLASSCNKEELEEETLPPITQEGLNTFGCYIDGELLVPKDYSDIGTGTSEGLSLIYNNDYLSITAANRSDNGGDYIYIYVPKLTAKGEYLFGQSNGKIGIDSPMYPHAFIKEFNGVDIGKQYYSYSNSGKVNITRFDAANSIISGTFELKVYNSELPNDTIIISEGRFDIDWIKLWDE